MEFPPEIIAVILSFLVNKKGEFKDAVKVMLKLCVNTRMYKILHMHEYTRSVLDIQLNIAYDWKVRKWIIQHDYKSEFIPPDDVCGIVSRMTLKVPIGGLVDTALKYANDPRENLLAIKKGVIDEHKRLGIPLNTPQMRKFISDIDKKIAKLPTRPKDIDYNIWDMLGKFSNLSRLVLFDCKLPGKVITKSNYSFIRSLYSFGISNVTYFYFGHVIDIFADLLDAQEYNLRHIFFHVNFETGTPLTGGSASVDRFINVLKASKLTSIHLDLRDMNGIKGEMKVVVDKIKELMLQSVIRI